MTSAVGDEQPLNWCIFVEKGQDLFSVNDIDERQRSESKRTESHGREWNGRDECEDALDVFGMGRVRWDCRRTRSCRSGYVDIDRRGGWPVARPRGEGVMLVGGLRGGLRAVLGISSVDHKV